MKYIGIQTQKRRNNIRSALMLCLFPCIILLLAWTFFLIWNTYFIPETYGETYPDITQITNRFMINIAPWVMGLCLGWFLIAYFANTFIINGATGSQPLERRNNKRVYNLVENLCIASHTAMPKINVIEDHSLNAFASGINKRTHTITLSRGIINHLNDAELEAVIAHELTHIRNNDVKVLIVSIVFVGIFSFVTQALLRTLFNGSLRMKNNNKKSEGSAIALLVIALALAFIGYLVTLLMRFAISRNREYMADAGSAELTKNPQALASALTKVSADPYIEAVSRSDIAQLFINNPMKKSFVGSLFASHPPIEKRIRILEAF